MPEYSETVILIKRRVPTAGTITCYLVLHLGSEAGVYLIEAPRWPMTFAVQLEWMLREEPKFQTG